jgi:hypothetical protein
MTSGVWLPSPRSIDRIRRNVPCHRFTFCHPIRLKWKRQREKSRPGVWRDFTDQSTGKRTTSKHSFILCRVCWSVIRRVRTLYTSKFSMMKSKQAYRSLRRSTTWTPPEIKINQNNKTHKTGPRDRITCRGVDSADRAVNPTISLK